MRKTTGERLKEYMQATGLHQAGIVAAVQPLCARDGVKLNRSDISQYVTGKTIPRQEKLMLLSEALNVDVAWLMGYDVPMQPVAQPQATVSGVSMQEMEQEGFYHLTDAEKRVLTAYRKAEETYRMVALELMESHPKQAE
ncbi:MAG: helix-turn-helix domain-containing protein [Aristaeellaceae bacterium]